MKSIMIIEVWKIKMKLVIRLLVWSEFPHMSISSMGKTRSAITTSQYKISLLRMRHISPSRYSQTSFLLHFQIHTHRIYRHNLIRRTPNQFSLITTIRDFVIIGSHKEEKSSRETFKVVRDLAWTIQHLFATTNLVSWFCKI